MPLTIAPPNVDCRELPESSRGQITPLEVSVEMRRSRLNLNATSSDGRVSSSNTSHAIASALEAATVVSAVASSCVDDSGAISLSSIADNNYGTDSVASHHPARTTIVEEKSKYQCPSETTLVVVSPYEDRLLTLEFRQTVASTVVGNAWSGAQTQLEHVELDKRASEKTQFGIAVEDSCALETRGRGCTPSLVDSRLPSRRLHTAQYVVGRDDAGASDCGYVSERGTRVNDFDKGIIQSLHGDMVQTRPSTRDDDNNDSRFTSQESRWAFYCFP